VKLHNQHVFISMMIDGEKAPPFSAKTLQMPKPEADFTPQIIAQSNQRFASDVSVVSEQLRAWAEEKPGGNNQTATTGASATDETSKPDGSTPKDQKPNFLASCVILICHRPVSELIR